MLQGLGPGPPLPTPIGEGPPPPLWMWVGVGGVRGTESPICIKWGCTCPNCTAALALVPNTGAPGGEPWIACPHFRKRECIGYIRSPQPTELHLLPRVLGYSKRLE